MNLIIDAIEEGLLFSIVSMGVYITYKILDFPDLSVDGTYPLGAAITAVLLINGVNPWLAIIISAVGGAIAGLTLLGGEPFEPENQRELVKLLRRVREELPEKNIWSFTGFVLDQDLLDGGRKHCEVTDEMLSLLDVLVDGPFKEEEKDITLAFRGSRNQRLIDMKKSLKEQEVIELEV